MIDITTGVQEVLAHPELLSGENDSLADLRRRQASELTTDPALLDRIVHAPTTYVLAQEPALLLEHAHLIEPAPHGRNVRVSVQPTGDAGTYVLNVACRNRPGLLSRLTGVLANEGISVMSASIATWPDNSVLDTFVVQSPAPPDPTRLVPLFARSLRGRLQARKLILPPPRIALENSIHPWHSVLRVSGPDQLGLLSAVSFALSNAGVQVHHAVIQTKSGIADDEFEVSDRAGRKITDERADAVRRVLNKLT
jgi:[protein-PII] uridylyltransferase